MWLIFGAGEFPTFPVSKMLLDIVPQSSISSCIDGISNVREDQPTGPLRGALTRRQSLRKRERSVKHLKGLLCKTEDLRLKVRCSRVCVGVSQVWNEMEMRCPLSKEQY